MPVRITSKAMREIRIGFPKLARGGWVVLTKDRHIRYRTPEKEALKKAGVAVFVLTSGNLTGDDMARAFVTAMPRIKRLLAKLPPPFIAKVARGGTVSLLNVPRGRGRRRG